MDLLPLFFMGVMGLSVLAYVTVLRYMGEKPLVPPSAAVKGGAQVGAT